MSVQKSETKLLTCKIIGDLKTKQNNFKNYTVYCKIMCIQYLTVETLNSITVAKGGGSGGHLPPQNSRCVWLFTMTHNRVAR